MKTRSLNCTASMLLLFIVAVTITLAWSQIATEASEGFDAKVSESKENGKYQRTTTIFQDKVLISKKQEVSIHDNGTIDVVFTKLFRNGEMIYASSSYNSKKNTVRSYYYQGKIIIEEGDEDGDGFFETTILFDANEHPIEAFSKSKDGTVAQFSEAKLAELKRSFLK